MWNTSSIHDSSAQMLAVDNDTWHMLSVVTHKMSVFFYYKRHRLLLAHTDRSSFFSFSFVMFLSWRDNIISWIMTTFACFSASNARHNIQQNSVSSEKEKNRWLNSILLLLHDLGWGTSELVLFGNIQTKEI